MDEVAEEATLIFDATIHLENNDGHQQQQKQQHQQKGQTVVSFRNQFLWLYWKSPHDTIYGCFCKGLEVQKKHFDDDNNNNNNSNNSLIFHQPGKMQFAVKLVSIQEYERRKHELAEDPYNEIHISRHIRRSVMRDGPSAVIRNGIIVPIDVLSNKFQQHPPIDPQSQFYFVISQSANKGDLFDNVVDFDLCNDLEAIRHLFRQMVKAIHCLHNELHVFHRDISVENFVLDGNCHEENSSGDRGRGGNLNSREELGRRRRWSGDRIFVIDFGQAQVVEKDENGTVSERIVHDGAHFGKVST